MRFFGKGRVKPNEKKECPGEILAGSPGANDHHVGGVREPRTPMTCAVIVLALLYELMCASPVLGADQWISLGGIAGIRLVVDIHGDLYSSQGSYYYGQVFKLPSGSSTWQVLQAGLSYDTISALTAGASGKVYAGTPNSGVFFLAEVSGA